MVNGFVVILKHKFPHYILYGKENKQKERKL